MSAITTHILDITAGQPAAGIPVTLERKNHSSGWETIAEGMTDFDGRANDLMAPNEIFQPGHYRLSFDTAAYFAMKETDCFFPYITVSFVIRDAMKHYHVPLLLSPFGYSTYRGS
jgi:5-hydroxyisourate hydrolase